MKDHRYSMRRLVLRHLVLKVLAAAERPLRSAELRTRIGAPDLGVAELGNMLADLSRAGMLQRIPVTYAMWLDLQAQGVRGRPTWLYTSATALRAV